MKLLSGQILVEGRLWNFVRNRASGKGQIFLSEDRSVYLRTGSLKSIRAEVAFSTKLRQQGFPVPEVISSGNVEGAGYFTERSLGDETFGTIFRREFSEMKRVSDAAFDMYCDISQQTLAAQLRTADTIKQNVSSIKTLIRLENVIQENPDLDSVRLRQAVDKAIARTKYLPRVLTHGDFTPFNILAKGIIDFEHSYIAPVGYDVLTSVIWGRLWNFKDASGVLKFSYDFTDAQIKYYRVVMDRVAAKYGIEKLSDYSDEFTLLKSIWSLSNEKRLAQLSGQTNKWLFRRAAVMYCVEQYLSHETIDTKVFGNLTYMSPSE